MSTSLQNYKTWLAMLRQPDAKPQSQDCRIHLMQEADLPAYKLLRDAMLARHPQAFTSDAETETLRSAESYRSRLSTAHNLFTLVAWLGPRMVGAISCERDPRTKVRHIAHVVGMMVSDDCQGQGLGQLLLESALALLPREPALAMVTLSVTSSNAAAVRLYERCGFTRYGRLEGAIRMPDGSLLDKDLMSRKLK